MTQGSQLFPELGFGSDRTGLPLANRLARLGRRLFPVKTARQMAARAGVMHRAAELWLEDRTGVSGDALAEMLRSDIGLHVLDEVMGHAKPTWWPEFRAAIRIKSLEQRAEAARVEMAEIREDLERRAASRHR